MTQLLIKLYSWFYRFLERCNEMMSQPFVDFDIIRIDHIYAVFIPCSRTHMIDLLYHLRVYKCKHRSFTLVYTYRKNQFLGTLARSGVHLLHAISYGEQLSRLSFFMPGANRVQPGATGVDKHGINGFYRLFDPRIWWSDRRC